MVEKDRELAEHRQRLREWTARLTARTIELCNWLQIQTVPLQIEESATFPNCSARPLMMTFGLPCISFPPAFAPVGEKTAERRSKTPRGQHILSHNSRLQRRRIQPTRRGSLSCHLVLFSSKPPPSLIMSLVALISPSPAVTCPGRQQTPLIVFLMHLNTSKSSTNLPPISRRSLLSVSKSSRRLPGSRHPSKQHTKQRLGRMSSCSRTAFRSSLPLGRTSSPATVCSSPTATDSSVCSSPRPESGAVRRSLARRRAPGGRGYGQGRVAATGCEVAPPAACPSIGGATPAPPVGLSAGR
jgi:hypothetical protein